MKLYKATLEIYVLANGEYEAKVEAAKNEEDAEAWNVEIAQSVPDVWLGCYPWGVELDKEYTAQECLEMFNKSA